MERPSRGPGPRWRRALAAIEREPVDVIVLDLVMPNIDGFEVLARLKEVSKDARSRFVVPVPIDRLRIAGAGLGANVFLTKPSTPQRSPRRSPGQLEQTVTCEPLACRLQNYAGRDPIQARRRARRASPSTSSLSGRESRRSSIRRRAVELARSDRPCSERLPLIEMITSPALMPALAAAESFDTLDTSAPPFLAPKYPRHRG